MDTFRYASDTSHYIMKIQMYIIGKYNVIMKIFHLIYWKLKNPAKYHFHVNAQKYKIDTQNVTGQYIQPHVSHLTRDSSDLLENQ